MNDTLQSALTIEAMRLGVVPATDLEQSTVGRETEIEIIKDDLEKCSDWGGARRAFLGEYGLGKTHLLELIMQIALKKNYLVSKIILDHEENSPSQPKRIYHAVTRHLRYPDRGDDFEGLLPLLQKAAASEKALELFQINSPRTQLSRPIKDQIKAGLHLYLSPAIAYIRALSDPEHLHIPEALGDPNIWAQQATHSLLDWIEGHPTRSNQDIDTELNRIRGKFPKIYSMLDYRPWAKIYGYILNGISTLAKTVGYAGLVIVIDEAEFYSLLSSSNRAFAKFLFQAWSLAAGGHEEDALPFTQKELLTGGYGIQRDLPAKYSEQPGLYLVFAMTPNSDGIRVLHEALPPHLICYLNQLSPHDYLKITEHTCALYNRAYPDAPLPEGISTPLADVVNGLIQQGQFENPRQAMKFLTEFLDIVRYSPEKIPDVISSLKEQIDF